MNLFALAGIWLVSWILIIVIHSFALIDANKNESNSLLFFSTADKEMIQDGSNLFATGFVYMILNIICNFISVPAIRWIIFVILLLFAIPSIFSLFVSMIPQAFKYRDRYISLMTITAFFCSVVPLTMALNIYFCFIK